jgi:hypothetical protein
MTGILIENSMTLLVVYPTAPVRSEMKRVTVQV